jgi:hypothetical protein
VVRQGLIQKCFLAFKGIHSAATERPIIIQGTLNDFRQDLRGRAKARR